MRTCNHITAAFTYRFNERARLLKHLMYQMHVEAAIDIILVKWSAVQQLYWIPCFEHCWWWSSEVPLDGF